MGNMDAKSLDIQACPHLSLLAHFANIPLEWVERQTLELDVQECGVMVVLIQ
jgi:hypothetical protein